MIDPFWVNGKRENVFIVRNRRKVNELIVFWVNITKRSKAIIDSYKTTIMK